MNEQAISELCAKISRTYLTQPLPPSQRQGTSEYHRNVMDSIASGILGMRRFDTPEVKKYALSVLDNEKHRNEITKVERELSDTRTDSEKQIIALLRWFKKDLFTWVNKLPCEFCEENNTTLLKVDSANHSESSGNCSRVEVYQCPKCKQLSRFPRFNDPIRVLEARRGRCGEYTTGFISLVRSLGYDARLVNDFEDHVWAEVYFPGLKRWLHADPSEGILDEPLTYAVGWGKQPVIMIGTSAQSGACDVTSRYSPDFAKLVIPRRRQKGLSGRLVHDAIYAANAVLAQPPSVAGLLQRQREEQVELAGFVITPRQTGFHAGRQSGSAEWRTARGENGSTPIEIGRFSKIFDSTMVDGFVLNGSATPKELLQEVSVTLTPSKPDKTGSAFFKTPVDILNGFRLRFKFQVSEGEGADGLAVVFQAQGPSALGEGGCGLGYAGIENAVALEIDTYRSLDRCSDPDGNHISLQAGKQLASKYGPVSSHHHDSLGWAPAAHLPNFQTGDWFWVSITILPSRHFQVSIRTEKDDKWTVVLDIAHVDLCSLTNGHSLLYIGFSAATGGLFQSHTVAAMEFVQLDTP